MEEALEAQRENFRRVIRKQFALYLGKTDVSDGEVFRLRASLHLTDGTRVASYVDTVMAGNAVMEPVVFAISQPFVNEKLYIMFASSSVADGPGYIVPVDGLFSLGEKDVFTLHFNRICNVVFEGACVGSYSW